MDCSTRVYLKGRDMTPIDLDGKNITDLAEQLGRAFSRGQFLTDRMHTMMLLTYIDPDQHVGYIQHRRSQEQLEVQHRRGPSVQGRIQAQAKKEENSSDSLEDKNRKIDKLKKELSEAKNAALSEPRKMYVELQAPDKAGGAWKNKGRGAKASSEGSGKPGEKKDAGDGGGGGGGGGCGGGYGKNGRKRGGGRKGKGGGGGKGRRGKN